MKKLFFIGLLLLSCAPTVLAQDELHPILESASVDIDGSRVIVHWKISGGNTCNGIDILRTDNPQLGYTLIGFIDGICGSVAEAIAYTFIDESPIPNSINYYKINFGAQGSETLSIAFVALDKTGTLIAPNPMVDQTIIYFENSGNQIFEFYLFDTFGRTVNQQSNIKSNAVTLNRTGLTTGSYHFLLQGENGVQYSGTVIVS